MDVDFIKWMVGYAEGFEWNSKSVVTPHDIIVPGSNKSIWNNVYYPLLLQRAIEGIEKNYDIEILAYWNKSGKCYESQVFDTEPLDIPLFKITYTDYKTIDQAKEQALKYIYEQEKNK